MLQIGPDGVTLQDIDVSPAHLEMLRIASGRKTASQFLITLAPQVPFLMFFGLLISMHDGPLPLMLTLLLAYISMTAWLTSNGRRQMTKFCNAKRIEQRVTITLQGLRIQYVVDGRLYRQSPDSLRVYPWRLVSPQIYVSEEGKIAYAHSDPAGRVVVPERCFETPEQRELFISLAGGTTGG